MPLSARALAPAAALLVGLGGCGAATPAQHPAGAASGSPAGVTTVTLRVAGGKVTGDTGRVTVPRGATVDVVVTADVVDEVHLHGYDLHVETVAGSPVREEFVADVPGVFEVELERAHTPLTRLQVQ